MNLDDYDFYYLLFMTGLAALVLLALFGFLWWHNTAPNYWKEGYEDTMEILLATPPSEIAHTIMALWDEANATALDGRDNYEYDMGVRQAIADWRETD